MLYPFLELFLIIHFSDVYSFGDVLLFMMTTGILGFLLMSFLGRALLLDAQKSFSAGKIPSTQILHRVFMLAGGFLIFLPGVLSDLLGLLLILPGSRHLIVFLIRIYLAKSIAKGQSGFFWMNQNGFSFGARSARSAPERDAKVIDIEAIESSRQFQNNDNEN